MKEGLEILYRLQLQDDQIISVENLIKEIPSKVKKMESERDGKTSMLENSKAKLNLNIKKREKFEKEILLVKEKINKYKDQMSKATTNKEFQGFTAEIKFEEEHIAGIEEKIIECMLESDEIMEEIRKSEADLDQVVAEYNNKIKDLKGTMEYNKTRRQERIEARTKLRSGIKPKLLKTYDVLIKKRHGKAVSLVETEFCGVCQIKIRPQRLNELIASEGMFLCESCGRLLYKKMEVEKEA